MTGHPEIPLDHPQRSAVSAPEVVGAANLGYSLVTQAVRAESVRTELLGRGAR